ncbi:MAG TPA: hypothetical protein VI542_38055 [Candidatus Tectomicrobia bacterium]
MTKCPHEYGTVIHIVQPRLCRRRGHQYLVAFALGHTHLAGMQINIGESELKEFGIAYPGAEQQYVLPRILGSSPANRRVVARPRGPWVRPMEDGSPEGS